MLFSGPPGVGKTEMAKHLCNIMFENHLLPGSRFISLNASQLKAPYVGQTAPLVARLFEEHDALLIDEAYSLTANEYGRMDIFSQEALAQLCVELEKHSKHKLIIFAGYGGFESEKNNLMKQFLEANPGIASRITFYISFPPYSADKEMPEIFRRMAENAEDDLEEGWRNIATDFFIKRSRSENIGNAREARKLLQLAQSFRAERLPEDETDIDKLKLLTCEDLAKAAESILRGSISLEIKKHSIGFRFL